jgi:hypothetical protein
MSLTCSLQGRLHENKGEMKLYEVIIAWPVAIGKATFVKMRGNECVSTVFGRQAMWGWPHNGVCC